MVLLMVCTYQVFVAPVDGQVAQGDGHSSDHLVGVGAQQLHQDGQALLLTHRGSDVVGPLEGRQSALTFGMRRVLFDIHADPRSPT